MRHHCAVVANVFFFCPVQIFPSSCYRGLKQNGLPNSLTEKYTLIEMYKTLKHKCLVSAKDPM